MIIVSYKFPHRVHWVTEKIYPSQKYIMEDKLRKVLIRCVAIIGSEWCIDWAEIENEDEHDVCKKLDSLFFAQIALRNQGFVFCDGECFGDYCEYDLSRIEYFIMENLWELQVDEDSPNIVILHTASGTYEN